MNSGISKKVIFYSLFFLNFIQPSKSAEFYKINKINNKQSSQLIWSNLSPNKTLTNSNKSFSKNKFEQYFVNKNIVEKNSKPLLAELSQKQKELIIQSDKQSEINDVIYAEGNVSVSYKGKLLQADNLIFDKLSKKISAKGNITLSFGEQIFKISQLEYNFLDETGFLLDVKGSINSDKLITDISSHIYNSDIQNVDDLINLQKEEVLNTPDNVKNWIFSTERISIDGKNGRVTKQYFLMIYFNLNK